MCSLHGICAVSPQFSQLVSQLYACVQDPSQWGSTLDDLARELNVRTVALQWCTLQGSRLHPEQSLINRQALPVHERYDQRISNEGNPRMGHHRLPQLLDKVVLDADFEPLGSPVERFRSQLQDIGLGRFIGCATSVGDGKYLAIAMHQDLQQDRPFTDAQIMMVEMLSTHLRQISRLNQHLSTAVQAQHDLMGIGDSLRAATLVCDTSGHISWHNAAAARLLSLPGAPLTCAGGRLHCLREADRLPLSQALLHPAPTYLGMGNDTDPVQLQLCVQALPSQHRAADLQQGARRVIALSNAREPQELSPAAIASLFHLTPAEARLASALCQGISLDGYAQTRGLSVGTVRVQAKQIMAKTHTTRQADLVRLMLSSVIGPTQSNTVH